MTNRDGSKTKKRYVAMLDIMGFKAIVENTESEIIYDLLEKVNDEANRQRSLKELDITIFSDTIIIVSKDDAIESYEDIVISSSNFFNLFLKNGYAINGAISFGDVTFDKQKNICFGEPVKVDHILQEDLLFYGIVLHKSADKQRRTYTDYPFTKYNVIDMITDFKVPIKSKGMQVFYCVNWCETFFEGNACFEEQIDPVKECIRNIYKKNKKSGRGMFYIMNTEMVLKQWFDLTAKTNGSKGWGNLISEEVETRCPEYDDNVDRKDFEYND